MSLRPRIGKILDRHDADPWFCLPVCVAILLDGITSLAFQPASYWADPSTLQEANSTWAYVLGAGPVVFLLVFLLYVLVMGGLMCWVTGSLQKLLGTFILLSHSYGAASWFHVELSDRSYWWALMLLFLCEAGMVAVYWHLSRSRRRES